MTAGPRPDRPARRDRVRAALPDLDVLLVTAAPDVRYLSGFAGSNGQVLLAAEPDGDRLLTDDRYLGPARALADLEVVLARDPLEVALEAGHRRVAVLPGTVTWATARRWSQRCVEAGGELLALDDDPIGDAREVKDDAELAALAEACRLTGEALTELFDHHVRAGATERELATWLERRFVDLGAEAVAFPSIVAAGPNGAVPHHTPTDRPVADGELLTVDCGARVDGYHADCTRTVAVGRGPDAGLAEVYEVVRQAQAAGRAAAVAGAASGDVDAAARSVVDEAGLGERFVHGTGHGVGLEIHERPAVARGASARLVAGTALTVEPGVYLPGSGGVRIEDTVVVTADGAPRVLTDRPPRELRVVGSAT